MFKIVLFEPEIPPNTGNIMRLAVNTGCTLHLIKPLGFTINDKTLQRAGLDYIRDTDYCLYNSFNDYISTINTDRLFLCSTKAKTT